MIRKQGRDAVTVIKRRAKKNDEPVHSAAWKVAFADFTLAMMALFMVLWVVQAMKAEQEAARNERSGSPVWEGGAGVFDSVSQEVIEVVSPALDAALTSQQLQRTQDPNVHLGQVDVQELKELAKLMNEMALEINAESNLLIEVVPQGLRILIRDHQQRVMFQRGSAELTGHFQPLIERLAGVLARVDNKLIISGHTDATPYRGDSRYNNWNLSGDRALQARNVLVQAGLPVANVLQVTAQAERMPLLPEQPDSGANRRIELLLLTSHAEQLYQELFGDSSDQAHVSEGGVDYRSDNNSRGGQ